MLKPSALWFLLPSSLLANLARGSAPAHGETHAAAQFFSFPLARRGYWIFFFIAAISP
jgi:hypothetical protein